jgi:hypothetical protein
MVKCIAMSVSVALDSVTNVIVFRESNIKNPFSKKFPRIPEFNAKSSETNGATASVDSVMSNTCFGLSLTSTLGLSFTETNFTFGLIIREFLGSVNNRKFDIYLENN